MAVKQRTQNQIRPHNDNGVVLDSTNESIYTDGETKNPVIDDSVDVIEIYEIISTMREKGTMIYHINCKERCDIVNDELVSLWRQMLVKWMFYVVDCCMLQRHAVAVAAYFLDVAMLRDLCKTREDHQLAAATALQMALKTFDIAVIQLDKLVKLGQGAFTEDDVAEMEMKIICSLNWYLHPPTVYCYLLQYEQLAPVVQVDPDRKVLNTVLRIIAEEMTLDERYIKYCPSIQGLAAMMVALDFVPDVILPTRHRQIFESRLTAMADTKEELKELSKVIKKIYRTLKTTEKFEVIIDATSTNTKGAKMYQKAIQSVENNSKKKQTQTKKLSSREQHSPRDVRKPKLRIKKRR